MARLALGALLSLGLALLAPARAGSAAPAEAAPVAVVAHPEVPAERLSRAQARRLFLLRQRFWGDGSRVAPVNLPAASPVRDAFSRSVLGRPARDLADYWNDLYFHGTPPPPVLESERAVLLYVARVPGAVGYVSQGALRESAGGVKVLLLVGP